MNWAISPKWKIPSLWAACQGLPLKRISEPVQTEYGHHLIQVLEHCEARHGPRPHTSALPDRRGAGTRSIINLSSTNSSPSSKNPQTGLSQPLPLPEYATAFAKSPVLLALCLALCLAPRAGALPELIDRIVATVDNHTILWSELNYRLRFEAEQRGLSVFVESEQIKALRREILDAMIDEQVLVLKAKQDSIQIDPTEVEEMLGQQFQLAKSSMDDGEFEQMLERVGLSERQLKARYRKEIRHRLLSRQMRAFVLYRVHVSHRDVEEFRIAHQDTLPSQISLSHILIKVQPSDEVLKEKASADRRDSGPAGLLAATSLP